MELEDRLSDVANNLTDLIEVLTLLHEDLIELNKEDEL